jgi:pentatricopeptide repeat protein
MRESKICKPRAVCFLTPSTASATPARGKPTRTAQCETRPQQDLGTTEFADEQEISVGGLVDSTSSRAQRTCDSSGAVCIEPVSEFSERLVVSTETNPRTEGNWYFELPWPDGGLCSQDQGGACRKAPDVRLPRGAAQGGAAATSVLLKHSASLSRDSSSARRQTKPGPSQTVASFLFSAQKVVDAPRNFFVSSCGYVANEPDSAKNLSNCWQVPLEGASDKPAVWRQDVQETSHGYEYSLATERVAFETASDVLADEEQKLFNQQESSHPTVRDNMSPSFSTSGDSTNEDPERNEITRFTPPRAPASKTSYERRLAESRNLFPVSNLNVADADLRSPLHRGASQHRSDVSLAPQVREIRSTRQLNKILSALYKSGRAADALSLCRIVEREGHIEIDVASYSILISCLGKCGASAQAIEMFHKMIRNGVAPNAFTFSALFGALTDGAFFDQAMRLFQMIRASYPNELNVVVYNAVLKYVGRAGRIDAALDLLGQMEQNRNVQPDIVTYGTILDICAKKQDVSLAYAVLDRMRKRGMRPNNFCYASLIDACARAGLPDQAESLFRQLRAEGLEYDLFICNALLGAFARAKMVERAFQAFEEMRSAGVRGDRITFNTLITAAARAREFDKAWKAFETMKKSNISADATTYNALIDACSKSGMTELAFALFNEMRQAHLQPTIFTFNALIGACTKLQDMRRATQVLMLMHGFGVYPDTFTLNILLTACARNEDFDYAISLVREFETNYRVRLDRLGSSIVTNLCIKACDSQSRDRCLRLLEAAVLEGYETLREVRDRARSAFANPMTGS